MRIMLVDDEPFVTQGLIRNLAWKSLGVDEIFEADDGQHGLELASKAQPDIVISDIRMPRMDGIGMVQRLREMLPKCRVILLSAYSDREYLKSAIKMGVVGYAEKPVELEEIEALIRQAVGSIYEERLAFQAQMEQKKRVEAQWVNELLEDASSPWSGPSLEGVWTVVRLQYETNEEFPVLEEALRASVERVWIGSREGNRQTMLVNRDMGSVINQLGPAIEQVPVFAGLAPATHFSEFRRAFKLSNQALQDVYYQGYRGYSTPRASPPSVPINGDLLLQEFREILGGNDQKGAVRHLNQLIIRLRRRVVSVDQARNILYGHVVLMTTSAMEKKLALGDGGNQRSITQMLLESDTLTKGDAMVRAVMRSYWAAIESRKQISRTVAGVMGIVQRDLGDPDLTQARMATELKISEVYASRKFKQETGQTIHEYVLDCRVKRAKKLLSALGPKLLDISAQCGFRDPSYFTKVFKQATGSTPSVYRDLQIPKGHEGK